MLKSWKEVQQQIIAGLQEPVGSSGNDVARLRLARMTAICEYHRDQELEGESWAVSSLDPDQIESFSTL